MVGITGKITCDFTEIAELLRQIPDEFIIKDVRTVQRAEWNKVMEAAKRLAPVDTGRLREMIVSKGGYDRRNKKVFAIVGLRKIRAKERRKIRRRAEKRAAAGLPSKNELTHDANYGVFVEFGTRDHAKHPFMRPAFDENFQRVLDDYTQTLKAKLEWRLDKLKRANKRSVK